MAEHFTPGLMPRTYFRAPRVPFDFRALALAILGYLVWWSGDLLLSKIFDQESLSGAFLGGLTHLFKDLPFIGDQIAQLVGRVFRIEATADYSFWEMLIGGAWFLGVWAFFSLGICRITALRIARDEGMSLAEALKFSWKNWPSLLWVPLIVAGAIGIFAGLNALGGLVMSIPFVGQIFSIVIIPLAAISTLAILLVALGGIVGMPLIGAAAAWECNGSLDAVSRTFSYVFARPLQYFWNFFLIFLFTGVILLIGGWFTTTLVKTVNLGVASDNLEVLTDAPTQATSDERYADYDQETRDLIDNMAADTGRTPGREAPGIEPFAGDITTMKHAKWSHKLTAFMWWILLSLCKIGFFGFAMFYLLGGSTSVYADLRADVDGTEEDEIYLEEEEQAFDELAAGGPTSESGVDVAEQAAEEATSGDAPVEDADSGSDDAGDDGDAADGGDESSDDA